MPGDSETPCLRMSATSRSSVTRTRLSAAQASKTAGSRRLAKRQLPLAGEVCGVDDGGPDVVRLKAGVLDEDLLAVGITLPSIPASWGARAKSEISAGGACRPAEVAGATGNVE